MLSLPQVSVRLGVRMKDVMEWVEEGELHVGPRGLVDDQEWARLQGVHAASQAERAATFRDRWRPHEDAVRSASRRGHLTA